MHAFRADIMLQHGKKIWRYSHTVWHDKYVRVIFFENGHELRFSNKSLYFACVCIFLVKYATEN